MRVEYETALNRYYSGLISKGEVLTTLVMLLLIHETRISDTFFAKGFEQ